MKEILDFIVLALFVFMVAMFIINFNRQQIKKHTDKLEEIEKIKNQKKEKEDA
ncbi:hypothetical protein [Aliarcobacter trophiarum]|uniref:Uncharacterized protein n=1 Tax=Aliarcobacter trophiarum LMG 25534 TaxID=1032241 RepID=A0AAD0VLW5_9BACT|nr:hypothetical protein [Aliarcobacter trophiarum]AXK48692.1 hypothetical protein ATR_0824 [Aliarcobacter trophiarum LMG 25534]